MAETTPRPPRHASWSVRENVLAAMTAAGDLPATDEIYAGHGAQYSETFAVSGARYIWLRSTDSVYRYVPSRARRAAASKPEPPKPRTRRATATAPRTPSPARRRQARRSGSS